MELREKGKRFTVKVITAYFHRSRSAHAPETEVSLFFTLMDIIAQWQPEEAAIEELFLQYER